MAWWLQPADGFVSTQLSVQDANDAVLEVEGQQDYIVEMELCMKELEQKLRVQSRQVRYKQIPTVA